MPKDLDSRCYNQRWVDLGTSSLEKTNRKAFFKGLSH